MDKRSFLVGSLCLALAACGGARQAPQTKVETPPANTVTLVTPSLDTELKADAGGTLLKIEKVPDALGGNNQTRTTTLQYMGLTPGGWIKLRIVSSGPGAAGPVDLSQDPAAAYTLEKIKVEFIEAQPSWVRYKLSAAGL